MGVRHAAVFNAGLLTSVANGKETYLAIHTMLNALGLTKTADTGQIDIPALTTFPTNVYHGYEIRSWTDSVGTVFMKFEYGLTSSSTYRFRITLGSGSDGVGNITGAPPTQTNMIITTNAITAYLPLYQIACRSGDSWSISFQTSQTPIAFTFDRQRDPVTGASIADSYYTFRTNANAGTTVCARPLEAFSIVDTSRKHAFAIDVVNGTGTSGLGLEPTLMEVMPLFGAWPHATIQPALMQYWAAEHMTPYGIFKANVYGQIRTYITIGLGNGSSSLITYNDTIKAGLAMLWED